MGQIDQNYLIISLGLIYHLQTDKYILLLEALRIVCFAPLIEEFL